MGQATKLRSLGKATHFSHRRETRGDPPVFHPLKRMRKPITFLFFVFLVPLVWAAEKQSSADLKLYDGTVLKAARIVGITEKSVTVVHSEGATTVALDQVPLDVLARAHMELEARTKERKQRTAEAAAKADAQTAESKAKRDEEIRIRLAEANARARLQGDEVVPQSPRNNPVVLENRLVDLKQKFPPKKQVQSSRGHVVDVPNVDVWSYYRGMIITTTPEALPRTLALIDARIASDIAAMEERLTTLRGSSTIERAQIAGTLNWLKNDLQRYLSALRTP